MNTQRVILIINGIQREVLCDPQKDSLATVVRRLGLTGTKVGCGTGQCGACSLLLDGKLVRSCVRLMKAVKSHAQVETIEGIGTASCPHPLQQAFLTYASVQCGFCSPGFIMSALALLRQNASPTRQQVREWFTRHNNICRCTGYKAIVDAVMAAAEVMRGEKTLADITFVTPADGRIYGTHFPKPTGLTRVLGTCDFGADIAEKMPSGSLHLAVVMARTHHGRIVHIDLEEATRMPGVVRVLTSRDIIQRGGSNRFFAPQGTVHSHCHGRERPILCEEKVYRYGDIVAVVAAYDRTQARAAAEKVRVDYAALPAALTFMEAVSKHAPCIHEGMPNVYMEQPLLKGQDTRDILQNAYCTVEGSFSTSRQPHLTIEPDVVQAYPEKDGVTIQCKTQYIYGIAGQIAEGIGLPKDKIRIIGNPAGGSFGYSMSPGNYGLAAACALVLHAPVSLMLSYEEHQHVTGKRAPVHAHARLGCNAEGKLQAMEYLVGLDHGAYSEMAGPLTTKVMRFFGYPYFIPHMRGLVRTAFTNGNFGTAFRAFGSPQAYAVSEQIVDMLAVNMGMDPFEFRYLNVAQPGETCTTSVPYREYPMQAMMDMLRPYYERAKEKATSAPPSHIKRGVGIAWGGYHVSKLPDHAEVDLELNADNTVTIYTTWADVGQGADLGSIIHAHEALRPLGLQPEHIHLVSNDTATCPDTGSASGSRSHHTAGLAILDAAAHLLKAMSKKEGGFRTWQEMKEDGLPTRFHGVYAETWADIDPDTGQGYGAVAQNYMLFMAEVEVDTITGKARVEDVNIVADIGPVGSYHAVLGQAWGGFSHAIGFALREQYDDMQKHATLRGAGVPRCEDIPDNFNVMFHVTPRANGPHGSTGCAEGFQSSGHAAVLNAITHALGVRIWDLPATPEKILAALAAHANGQAQVPPTWDLGCELHERLAWLKKNVVREKCG